MDFGDDVVQSSTSSSSQQPENVPSPTTPPFKHKKRAGQKIFKETRHPSTEEYAGGAPANGCVKSASPTRNQEYGWGHSPTRRRQPSRRRAALALRGENAPLNFPDSARLLPRAPSSSSRHSTKRYEMISSGGTPLLGTHRQANFDQTRTVSVENGTERASDSEGNDAGRVGFVDEEAMFNMPVLLDSLAEGLLLTPLAMSEGFSWSHDESDDDVELKLWA
ncbi:UNVERIFIED_CONTAM: Dehydration-responsive element-binding protein 1F [Sesamum latifolium]|uniref:Dehydration-responsive element-binding protein 1F n=1 Tax=Sesamum latifolium TaxID=2727402 RepID=A0AAW2Y2X8_9LAMI